MKGKIPKAKGPKFKNREVSKSWFGFGIWEFGL
jgi:hypothetical protein